MKEQILLNGILKYNITNIGLKCQAGDRSSEVCFETSLCTVHVFVS
jgi:hypothetical protein